MAASTSGPIRGVVAGALLLIGCASATREAPPAGDAAVEARDRTAQRQHDAAAPAHRRAIMVSFDALAERRALHTVPASAVPAFRSLFANGACTSGARPAFPSVTAPGHASLWTGTYGNVNGVSGNIQSALPRPEHTLLETISGYSAQALRAEPLWIAAADEGLGVAAHHVTQAPQAPGYTGTDRPEPSLDSARAAAAALLKDDRLTVMNGYNLLLAPARVLTEQDMLLRPASGWANQDLLSTAVPPRELAWAIGSDSMFALLHGGAVYDRILISGVRDVAEGAVARLAPAERADLAGRSLARHFATGRELNTEQGVAIVTARLFELTPDGRRFRLLVPEVRVIEGNHPDVSARYAREIGGWYGNGAPALLRSGALGATVDRGGDGSAEWLYLESLELVTRQFARGSEWLWRRGPRLQLDYFPLIDETDHEWLGLVTREAPGYDSSVAARVQEFRVRAWALADVRLRGLQELVRGDVNGVLLVVGDHGMRAYWKRIRINAVLREAGLLSVDSTGRIDLAQTRALSPAGYFVTVNRTAWKGGVVPREEEASVIDAAERALLAVRGADGAPLITRIWRSDAPGSDTLGIGGPTGGDLYYELAPGYSWNAEATGAVIQDLPRAIAGHGFPSVAEDMQTVFCLWGDGVPPYRAAAAGRTIDAAPTLADWLGIRAPAHAAGQSRLPELLVR